MIYWVGAKLVLLKSPIFFKVSNTHGQEKFK